MHDHRVVFEESISKGEEFSFHPKLHEWIEKKFPSENGFKVIEYGCEDHSCPITETLIEFSSGICLKIGREKGKISKMDFQFAIDKQHSGG